MEAVVFCGLQASGKSSFYRRYFISTHTHISLDVLTTRRRQSLAIEACIAARHSFVVDNTNPTRDERKLIISLAKHSGFRVVGYYFRSSLQESLPRNAQRDEKQRVPLVGILATHKKLQLPNYVEGFDKLFYVTMSADFEYSIQEWNNDF